MNVTMPSNSKREALVPTQPRAAQDRGRGHHKRALASQLLKFDFPVSDSANLSRLEDATLCSPLRSSAGDLTACASAPSVPKMKALVHPSTELDVPELPEIPDWFQDEHEQVAEATRSTPQSDYHSLADYHPASLCCQDAAELAVEERCEDEDVACSRLLSCRDRLLDPPVGQTPFRERSRAVEPRRRSYSLDLDLAGRLQSDADHPCAMSPNSGLGYGLGSPFSLSPLFSAHQTGPFPSAATDPDPPTLGAYPVSRESDGPAAHPNLRLNLNLNLNQSPPGLRRDAALAVWRPHAPLPAHYPRAAANCPHPRSPADGDDVRSLEQPFPSSASIWVLGARAPHALRAVTGLEHRRRAAWVRGDDEARMPRQKGKWSLEEQITIAVLEAMDVRDVHMQVATGALCSRLVGGKGEGRVRRLVRRIWKAGKKARCI